MVRPQLSASALTALLISSSSSDRGGGRALGFVLGPPVAGTHHPSCAASGRSSARIGMAEPSGDGGSEEEDKPVAGSFFNPVPEKQEQSSDGGDETATDAFDKSLAELMRRRQTGPKASQPSTIGGVPTSKAAGFGKPTTRVTKTKAAASESPPAKDSFVGIGKPDRPLNNVQNPEYDDQGYTLYADEETGKKSRVFEALVEYPCKFTMKIVGANEGGFAQDMVGVVAESCGVGVTDVEHKTKNKGKWISVTVQAPVQSAEMLYALYENIDRDPRVKFKF